MGNWGTELERGTQARKKRKKFVHVIHKISLSGFRRGTVISNFHKFLLLHLFACFKPSISNKQVNIHKPWNKEASGKVLSRCWKYFHTVVRFFRYTAILEALGVFHLFVIVGFFFNEDIFSIFAWVVECGEGGEGETWWEVEYLIM